MLVLTVIQGPDKGKTFELPDHEPQLLGRSGEALPLSDQTVSRRHAELTPDDGVWWLRDLSSQNGTHLNGVRITDRVRLRPGDQIRIGSTIFVFGTVDARTSDVIRVDDKLDATVERLMPSSEDSVLMGEAQRSSAAGEHLRVVYQLSALLGRRVLDRDQLLRSVMDLIFAEFRPERGVILLTQPDGSTKGEVVRYRTPPKHADEAKFNLSTTILQHALEKGAGVLASNAMSDARFSSHDSVQRLHIRSALCAPIMVGDKIRGALYIDSSMVSANFTAAQLALLNAIGQQTGLALSNAELVRQGLQSERLAAIGETVASLSHSIKNILQGLRGGADVVELGLKKEDLKIARGGWSILKRNLDRIMSLTLNMLAYSRQRRIEPEVSRVGAIVSDCVQLLEGVVQAREVALLIDIDPETPPITLDPNLIHQALMNLLTNAVEAVEAKKGVVTVRVIYHPPADSRSPEVEIAVIDNGPGISRDKQAWIFEPFNTTKGLRGTGLGLAVTKRIVEEHHGRLAVESDEGRGAAFRVYLPADRPAPFDPSQTAQSRPSAGEGPRVFH